MWGHNSSNQKSIPWKADEKKEGLEWSFNPTTVEERERYSHMWKRPLCITLEIQKLLQHKKTICCKVSRVWSTSVGYAVRKETRGKGLGLSNTAPGFYSWFFREVNSQTQLPELPENGSTFKLKVFQVQSPHYQMHSSASCREVVLVQDTVHSVTYRISTNWN